MKDQSEAVARIDGRRMATVLASAVEAGIAGPDIETVVFYDFDRFDVVASALLEAFPAKTHHALAVKANPVGKVLQRALGRGLGVEVASAGELALAVSLGFAPDNIVFDSPAKTMKEIYHALDLGVRINANSLPELDRIAEARGAVTSSSLIGVRVNPVVGLGSIETTSTATEFSKFGVSTQHQGGDLLAGFKQYGWLTGLHVHTGSQGMHLDQLVAGVGRAYDYFEEARTFASIDQFNLGGGLAVCYRDTDQPASFEEYAQRLKERCPALFDSGVTLATEFGRATHANSGWVASKVEYVLDHSDSIPTIVTHVGADMFLRRAYRPDEWHHDISVTDLSGELRVGQLRTYRVAGPLCFAGDYLSRSVQLPADVQPGDYLLIHDSGAYTFSMWSLYNSRSFPSIVGYEGGDPTFETLIPQQDPDELVRFWNGGR